MHTSLGEPATVRPLDGDSKKGWRWFRIQGVGRALHQTEPQGLGGGSEAGHRGYCSHSKLCLLLLLFFPNKPWYKASAPCPPLSRRCQYPAYRALKGGLVGKRPSHENQVNEPLPGSPVKWVTAVIFDRGFSRVFGREGEVLPFSLRQPIQNALIPSVGARRERSDCGQFDIVFLAGRGEVDGGKKMQGMSRNFSIERLLSPCGPIKWKRRGFCLPWPIKMCLGRAKKKKALRFCQPFVML